MSKNSDSEPLDYNNKAPVFVMNAGALRYRLKSGGRNMAEKVYVGQTVRSVYGGKMAGIGKIVKNKVSAW